MQQTAMDISRSFTYFYNPPVSLRLTAPFTQGGLVANRHSFANPNTLLTSASLHRGALSATLYASIHTCHLIK